MTTKADTVTQHRSKYIGGSDVPIIMDISFFKSRMELLQEKSGYLENNFEGNMYTEYGNVLEPMIRNYINDNLVDDPFKEECFIGKLSPFDDEKLNFRCNVDGMNSDTILEVKTTSNIKNSVDEYDVYLVQLLFYMINSQKEKGILAVYERTDFTIPEEIDTDKLQIFNISVSDYKELIEDILNSVSRFQDDLITYKDNPAMTEEDFLNPVVVENSKKVIDLENKLKEFKSLEEELKETKEKLFQAMKKYNVKKWTTLNGVSFSRIDETESKKESLDTKKLKAEQPKIYEKYKTEKVSKRKGYVRVSLNESSKNVKQLNNVNNEFKVEKVEGGQLCQNQQKLR